MRLSGLDLRIIPGVEMIFLHAPLGATRARRLRPSERKILETLSENLRQAREQAYQRAGTSSLSNRGHIIATRVAIEVEWHFAEVEARLVLDALDACILELRNDPLADVNIHFNGDEYGITLAHLEDLRRRLASGE